MFNKKRISLYFLVLFLAVFVVLASHAIWHNAPKSNVGGPLTAQNISGVKNLSVNLTSVSSIADQYTAATWIFTNQSGYRYNITIVNSSGSLVGTNLTNLSNAGNLNFSGGNSTSGQGYFINLTAFNTSLLPCCTAGGTFSVWNVTLNFTNTAGSFNGSNNTIRNFTSYPTSAMSSATHITIDNTAPTVNLTEAGRNPTSLNISVSTTTDATTCVTNRGTVYVVSGNSTQYVTATSLASNTAYSFIINCSDEVGNTGTATSTFITASEPPTEGGSTETVNGCTDSSACNYDSSAANDDGSCTYAELYYDCNGNCLSDSDADAVCDQLDDDSEVEVSEEEAEEGVEPEAETAAEETEIEGEAEGTKKFLGVKFTYWWIIVVAGIFAAIYFSLNKKKKK